MIHEREHEPRMRVFCPLEGEVVDVREECEHCIFWEDEECVAGRGRARRGTRRPRVRRSRPGAWRWGPRLRVPLVWDRWPAEAPADEQPPRDLGSDEYEQATGLDEELYPVARDDGVDWDHEAFEDDVPDWLEGVGEAVSAEPVGDEGLRPGEFVDEPWGRSASAAPGIREPPEPGWPEPEPFSDLWPENPMEQPFPPTPGFDMPDDDPEGAGGLPGGGPPQAPM